MNNRTVVIIGGGIIGSAIGFHLSLLNNKIIIIDKGPFQESCSAHSFAWINASSKSPIGYHTLCRSSVNKWPSFAKQLGTEIGLNLNGTIKWENNAKGAAAARERVETLKSWDYPIEIVDEEFIRTKDPSIKIKNMTFGQYIPNEGHVEPKRVIDACQYKIKENGGHVINDTAVTGFETDPDTNQITSVITAAETISCDTVVIAAGTGTQHLAGLLGIHIPLLESPGVVAWTDPQPKNLNGIIMSPAINDGTYPDNDEHSEVHIRQRVDGSYQMVNERGGIGNHHEQNDDSQEKADILLKHLTEYFPQLKSATAIAEPVGYRPMPEDKFPVLGFDKKCNNVYISVMHSGVTLAALVGEYVATEINYQVEIPELKDYRPSRFKK
tara:strand:+ start:9673 stop:10821 length:1149 start_codon:yes stop_codon:yes gene_type:complete